MTTQEQVRARPDSAGAGAAPPPISPRELRLVFAATMLAMGLSGLDQSIVNTALPRMASELGGLAHISWVVTAFLLTSTISTPLYGKLSDMYGRRRLFVVSIALFVAASVLCGMAQSMSQLIAFRALQGLGAGGLMTLAQTVIGDVVHPRDRGKYQALFTGTFAVTSVAGPLIGGVLTSALSWRWVFYVNVPMGALALTMIMIGLKKSPPAVRRQIDYAGAALLATGSALILLLLSFGGTAIPWFSLEMALLAVTSAILIALFLRQERRAAEPVMDLELFRNRNFTIGVVASSAMSFAMMGAMVFVPLYFQLVLGMSPVRAGMMMLPQIIMMLLGSIVGGQLVSRMGRIKPFLLLGVGLEVAALGLLALLAFVGAGAAPFLFVMAVLGCGMGFGMPNATVVVQNAVGREVMGVATATMSFLRSLGGVMGVAISGVVMAAALRAHLAGLAQTVDIPALLEGGIAHIAELSPDTRLQVADAYRYAIAGSFLTSALVMTVAFALVLKLRGVVLKGRDAPNDLNV